MEAKEKILIKAHELFVKHGIRYVTMDYLAQSLGMSKRTIYEYFTDKKVLVEAEVKYFISIINEETNRIAQEADNIISALINILKYFYVVKQHTNMLYPIEIKKYNPKAYEYIKENGTKSRNKLARFILDKGIEQGLFRNNFNMELVAGFLRNLAISGREAVSDDFEVYYGDFERDVLFSYLKGIATEKGRKMIGQEEESYFKQMSNYGEAVDKIIFKI